MFLYTLFFASLIFVASGQVKSDVPSCKLNNKECVNEIVSQVAKEVIFGVPALDIESADPMFFDYVEGNLNVISYKLWNSTIYGYRNCEFKNIDVEVNKSNIHLEFECPSLSRIVGKYFVNGHTVNWRVIERGDYEFILGGFKAYVDAKLGMIQAEDGKVYLKIKDFISKTKITGPIKAQFNSVYDEKNRGSSGATYQYGPDNWKMLADLLQEPLLMSSYKRLFRAANKFMKTIHLEL